MFKDLRAKKIVLVSHCILNQNSISDGTADYPATIKGIVYPLIEADVGIIQMPCPELTCLGLDRGDVHGGERPVVVENTRIRRALKTPIATRKMNMLVNQIIFQLEEYKKNGFYLLGIIGIDRSPSCGVNTTSDNNQETEGKGVFIEKLSEELRKREIYIPTFGVKGKDTTKVTTLIKTIVEEIHKG